MARTIEEILQREVGGLVMQNAMLQVEVERLREELAKAQALKKEKEEK